MDGETCRSQRWELFEEPHVVLVEEADVLDAILEHRHPLDAHSEGEAGDAVGIVSDGFEDRRMHHAAAENFEPPGLLADGAPDAGALVATDVDLGARFRVRKEARTQAHGHVTEASGSCTPGRLSTSSFTFILVRTR